MRKKEIPSFATTWVDFEGIKLSQISQRKTNTVRCYLYVEYKKAKLVSTEQKGGYQGQEGVVSGSRRDV